MHSPVISGAGEAVSCDPVPNGGAGSPPSLQSGKKDVHKVREITGRSELINLSQNRSYGLHPVPVFIAAGGNISHRTSAYPSDQGTGNQGKAEHQLLLHPKESSKQLKNNMC